MNFILSKQVIIYKRNLLKNFKGAKCTFRNYFLKDFLLIKYLLTITNSGTARQKAFHWCT